MEMKMQSIVEHEAVIVDLGAASVETQGAGNGSEDVLGTQIKQSGIADD
jgi:hypothetical protein